MIVKFCLKMEDAVIGTKNVKYFELKWQEELNYQQLADRFNTWLKDETFIESRLPDIKEAAFCQLSIDPS
jgi:hypothetical protein